MLNLRDNLNHPSDLEFGGPVPRFRNGKGTAEKENRLDICLPYVLDFERISLDIVNYRSKTSLFLCINVHVRWPSRIVMHKHRRF